MNAAGEGRRLRVSALGDGERRRGLEISWLATIGALFGTTTLSWFLGTLEVNAAVVLWSVFGCALGGLALDAILTWLEDRHGFRAALVIGQALKIFALGALWHLLGGIHNIAFLPLFFLPLLSASMFVMRGLVVVTAALSWATVTLVALLESPELRWYLVQIGFPLESLISRLPRRLPGQVVPFPDVNVGPEFQFVALLVFAFLLLSGTVVSWLLSARSVALLQRFVTASYAQDQSRDLFRSALRADPVPAVLVYADTGQIVEASRGFLNQMLLSRDTLAGKTVFECLSLSDASSIRALMARHSGELRFVTYRVGNEQRTAGIRCHRLRFGDADYASITFLDQNELSCLWTVCDAIAHPLLVIRNGCEVAYFNAAAERLCPELHFGMDPSRIIETPDQSSRWWTDSCASDVLATPSGPFRVQRFDLPERIGGEPLTLLGLFSIEFTDSVARVIGLRAS